MLLMFDDVPVLVLLPGEFMRGGGDVDSTDDDDDGLVENGSGSEASWCASSTKVEE